MKQINIRMGEGEFRFLMKLAEERGCTPTEAARALISAESEATALEERLIARIDIKLAETMEAAREQATAERTRVITEMAKLIDKINAHTQSQIKSIADAMREEKNTNKEAVDEAVKAFRLAFPRTKALKDSLDLVENYVKEEKTRRAGGLVGSAKNMFGRG
ncbi:MAG: hypothetical protein SCI25_04385 [Desulfuromonadales bacterium]|nr:hypothetical protein [Desulfuromonadales bacterium]MDW7758045.1 hypothetical protein [Desulfuromonadales bacterium]